MNCFDISAERKKREEEIKRKEKDRREKKEPFLYKYI